MQLFRPSSYQTSSTFVLKPYWIKRLNDEKLTTSQNLKRIKQYAALCFETQLATTLSTRRFLLLATKHYILNQGWGTCSPGEHLVWPASAFS